MGLNPIKNSNKIYLTIEDGHLAKFSDKDDPEAKKVVYESKKKRTEKFFKMWESLDCFIVSVDSRISKINDFEFREIVLDVKDEGTQLYQIQIKFSSDYGMNLLNRLYNMAKTNKGKEFITLKPYHVKDRETGKINAGVKIFLAGKPEEKIDGFFNQNNPEPSDIQWDWIEDAEGKKKPNKTKQLKFYKNEILEGCIKPYFENLYKEEVKIESEPIEEDIF